MADLPQSSVGRVFKITSRQLMRRDRQPHAGRARAGWLRRAD